MEAHRATLLWNPGTDQVKVVARPHARRYDEYRCSALGACSKLQTMDFDARMTQVFIEAMHLIVRDKCDPMAVHKALLVLDEYRDGLADDMPGMEDEGLSI